MKQLSAQPQMLKQANFSQIRKLIKNNFTATRAEIAQAIGVSSTTVRTLLVEMLESGEIESIGFDPSGGGRKAERYRFRPNRYFGAAFCINEDSVDFLLVTVCGEIAQHERLSLDGNPAEEVICRYLDGLTAKHEIKSVGIGVNGVVNGKLYYRQDRTSDALVRCDLGDKIATKYGVPVLLENNINAAAIGSGLNYKKTRTAASCGNAAYLHVSHGCIKAGFLSDGRIVRGNCQFAGELGLVRNADGTKLDAYLTDATDDDRYIDFVVNALVWICGILNPLYVTVEGADFRMRCLDEIRRRLSTRIPAKMMPEILFSSDASRAYHAGMASLTASKMFDDIQLVKE